MIESDYFLKSLTTKILFTELGGSDLVDKEFALQDSEPELDPQNPHIKSGHGDTCL